PIRRRCINGANANGSGAPSGVQRAHVEAVAAEVAGVAESAGDAFESVLFVELLRRVHAGQRFQVTALVAEPTRVLEAQFDQFGAGAMAAELRQEIHLAQFASAALVALQR